MASFYHLRILQFILLHTTCENSASSVHWLVNVEVNSKCWAADETKLHITSLISIHFPVNWKNYFLVSLAHTRTITHLSVSDYCYFRNLLQKAIVIGIFPHKNLWWWEHWSYWRREKHEFFAYRYNYPVKVEQISQISSQYQ